MRQALSRAKSSSFGCAAGRTFCRLRRTSWRRISTGRSPLSTARLETFADGVFAIAATLLILNVEVPEFKDVMPSVENIAKVIYELLKPNLRSDRAKLASVTVWETPKTWCEYSE